MGKPHDTGVLCVAQAGIIIILPLPSHDLIFYEGKMRLINAGSNFPSHGQTLSASVQHEPALLRPQCSASHWESCDNANSYPGNGNRA